MRRLVLIATLAAACVISACGGGGRPSKFYALEVPAATATTGEPYPVSIMVGRMTASHLLRDDRIVYRNAGLQMGTYNYHRWAEPPTDMLEAMLTRLLRTSGKYKSVHTLRSNAVGDYILRGRLHDFEEVAAQSGLVARVAFDVELFHRESGATVWSHSYSHDEPVSGKEVPDLVAALNSNTQAGLQQAAAALDRYFASQPPKQ
jgi:ABC-type uncharacterized transport system auxiliary subunit